METVPINPDNNGRTASQRMRRRGSGQQHTDGHAAAANTALGADGQQQRQPRGRRHRPDHHKNQRVRPARGPNKSCSRLHRGGTRTAQAGRPGGGPRRRRLAQRPRQHRAKLPTTQACPFRKTSQPRRRRPPTREPRTPQWSEWPTLQEIYAGMDLKPVRPEPEPAATTRGGRSLRTTLRGIP